MGEADSHVAIAMVRTSKTTYDDADVALDVLVVHAAALMHCHCHYLVKNPRQRRKTTTTEKRLWEVVVAMVVAMSIVWQGGYAHRDVAVTFASAGALASARPVSGEGRNRGHGRESHS